MALQFLDESRERWQREQQACATTRAVPGDREEEVPESIAPRDEVSDRFRILLERAASVA